MNFFLCAAVLAFALWDAQAYPYYPYYASNMDSVSYGSTDNQGAMVLSRYYQPYYNPRTVGGGMAAFMVQQPQQYQQPAQTAQSAQPTNQGYYLPERRRQTPPEANFQPPPQQNEVFYPQTPEDPTTKQTELADPTGKTEVFSTTARYAPTSVPEIVEPEVEEIEEPVQKPRKRIAKKKPVSKPIEEEDNEEESVPKIPAGAFFPMFFGWGGRSSGGTPGGAMAIANAYSTGRGGVATSHATSYGMPDPSYTQRRE